MNSMEFRAPPGGAWWHRWLSSIRGKVLVGLLAPLLVLGGCGGGGSSPADGEVVVGLTDAPGDFVTYTVGVTSLTLTLANGAVVETLPLSSQVDFAQYTDMTEFLTAATVPSGLYTKATLKLDYSNASIWVEDHAGNAVEATAVVDMEGNPITELEVSVHLEGHQALPIAPGIPAYLTLDFDLNATNQVEFGPGGEVTVTVEPVLLADVELENPKIHRVRGPLKSVNEAEGSYQVILRPFYHTLNGDHDRFGTLTVTTTSETVFEIDGEVYQGSSGLSALAAKPTFTATVASGELKRHPRRFEATEVYAGSSVPGGDADVVKGNVLSRVGDVVVVKGATLIRADGSIVFNDTVTVSLSAQTIVRKQLSMDPHTIADISVGQRITVFGNLTSTLLTDLQLDASNGYVRMQLTTVSGSVVDTSADPLQPFEVDLQAIDGRRVGLFDFAGTGIDLINDADPDHYEIDTGALDVSEIAVQAPLKVRGFVTAFGQAPKDFVAQTVIDLAAIPAVMAVNWNPATSAAVSAISTTHIELDMSGVGKFHHVARRGVVVDLTTALEAPELIAQADESGLFLIHQHGTVQLFTHFSQFATELEARLVSGSAVRWVHARGLYADSEAALTARFVRVKLE